MNLNRAIIKLRDYSVHIRVDEEGRIHLFKYNNRTCDFEVFDNQFDACEYILESLPDHYYSVRLENE
jgi:hypothetical protein